MKPSPAGQGQWDLEEQRSRQSSAGGVLGVSSSASHLTLLGEGNQKNRHVQAGKGDMIYSTWKQSLQTGQWQLICILRQVQTKKALFQTITSAFCYRKVCLLSVRLAATLQLPLLSISSLLKQPWIIQCILRQGPTKCHWPSGWEWAKHLP